MNYHKLNKVLLKLILLIMMKAQNDKVKNLIQGLKGISPRNVSSSSDCEPAVKLASFNKDKWNDFMKPSVEGNLKYAKDRNGATVKSIFVEDMDMENDELDDDVKMENFDEDEVPEALDDISDDDESEDNSIDSDGIGSDGIDSDKEFNRGRRSDSCVETDIDAESLADYDSEDEVKPRSSNYKGSKSASAGWKFAYETKVMDALIEACQPCNKNCYLSGKCGLRVLAKDIIQLREDFWGPLEIKAPKPLERNKRFLSYLEKCKKDQQGNLIFSIGDALVCSPTFLRFLGVGHSTNLSEANGIYTRAIKKFTKGDDRADCLLSKSDLKSFMRDSKRQKFEHAVTFILDYIDFMDDIPIATEETDDGDVANIKVPPFHSYADFYAEYEYHCQSASPPIPLSSYGKISTFKKAFKSLRSQNIVKLMGGKSGFPTCGCCNQMLAMKRSNSRRDEVIRDALRKLARLHLSQQATERQHALNVIANAKKLSQETGQPLILYIDIDAQSVWAGNTPRFASQKGRQTKMNSHIENRNIGVHIVCGPIDEYISVSTNNLIPGGGNILVEVTKYSIEYAINELTKLNLKRPFELALQFDNSGENKVI